MDRKIGALHPRQKHKSRLYRKNLCSTVKLCRMLVFSTANISQSGHNRLMTAALVRSSPSFSSGISGRVRFRTLYMRSESKLSVSKSTTCSAKVHKALLSWSKSFVGICTVCFARLKCDSYMSKVMFTSRLFCMFFVTAAMRGKMIWVRKLSAVLRSVPCNGVKSSKAPRAKNRPTCFILKMSVFFALSTASRVSCWRRCSETSNAVREALRCFATAVAFSGTKPRPSLVAIFCSKAFRMVPFINFS
mmetsp:Transcript_15545/g.46111  ORF Transcript_15545/g.46111 Transcript_15545/m.46111 type:complete len:247 (-) Transcript_15545:1823-2563(-)